MKWELLMCQKGKKSGKKRKNFEDKGLKGLTEKGMNGKITML